MTVAAALGARCLPCCSAANTGVTAVKPIVAAWRNGVVFLGAGVPSERTCHAVSQRRELLGAGEFERDLQHRATAVFVECDSYLVPASAQFDVAHLNCRAVVTIVINNKLVINIEAA